MKVVFLGSGPFGLPALEALHRRDGGKLLLCAITRPDRPASRGHRLEPTPVRRRALELGAACEAPSSVNDAEFLYWLRDREVDLVITADYGEILRPAFLSVPRRGVFNLHASLLPRHRGAAPVAYSILGGDTTTGVTLFRIERGLDTGPIVAQAKVDIGADETSGELEERLSRVAAELLDAALEQILAGTHHEAPQDGAAATLAPKLTKDCGLVDWRRGPQELVNFARALNPWPLAHSYLLRHEAAAERTALLRLSPGPESPKAASPGAVVEVSREGFSIACGGGCVRVLTVQRQGKPAMEAAAYACGRRLCAGDVFGAGGS